MAAKKWTKKEKELLKKWAPKSTKKEVLIDLFPDRSWNSIERMINRMSLEKGWLKVSVDPERDIEEEIERQKTQDTRKAYKEVVASKAFEERIFKAIVEAITAFPELKTVPKIKVPSGSPTEEAAVLLISDAHVGEVVRSDEMCGLSEYNFETFTIYLQFLVDTVIDIIDNKLRKGFNIQDLHIHALGDMVSGTIHEEFLDTNDANQFHSAFGGAFVFGQALTEFSPYFRDIFVKCIGGNHGRFTKDRRFKTKWNNWDFVFYQVLSLLLRNQKNIHFEIPYSSFIMTDVMGHTHFLSHGDNVRSYYGIPMYGIKRMASNFTEILAARGEYLEFINIAHFHEKNTMSRLGGELIINGGWKGGDEYSVGKMHTVSEPKQVMYGIHPRTGKTWEFDINFRMAKEAVDEVRYTYDQRAHFPLQVKERFDG